MRILGISAFYHDSAAALVVDGEIVAAAQEERFTRKKHDAAFPTNAIACCLAEGGTSLDGIDYVVFYEKPLLKFDRLVETYLAFVPRGFASFRRAIPALVKEKLFLRREILKGLGTVNGGEFKGHLAFTNHHESHAASAFFPSPFGEAAILCADGVGEWTTTSIQSGTGNRIESLTSQNFPHSLGLLYSAFTYYTGFKVNSGEYKLMGLAPYGEPVFADRILEHLIDLKVDGSYRLDLSYFDYCTGLRMTGRKFHRLFGHPPRKPESALSQFHMDIAASIQAVTEKAMLAMANEAHRRTKSPNLCLAGGVALNCVANGKILRESPFENIWIQPAAGDAGGALGAALFVWHQLLENPRSASPTDRQKGSLLGPAFSDGEIAGFLDGKGAVFSTAGSERELAERTARLLAEGKVVGWFQGRMEFGPRALGGRSILGDPRSPEMQRTLNLKIKFRESFRPFAPSVLSEKAHKWFDLREGENSPYMLLVAGVKDCHRSGDSTKLREVGGFGKLGIQRSTVQAITHVDFSARVQTVDEGRNPIYHLLLTEFEAITGCPMLINTSFNVRGEPIVCSPEDAYACFMATGMDVLVLGPHILLKGDQAEGAATRNRVGHLAKFELD
ncbi:carbamoyltransferase [Akkermansiaceae bacterium]|nr:carbamoyltransferase [Akkermansiaceae bacterium]